MGEQRRVVLYGNSIVLGSVGASLAATSRFEVTSFSPPLPGAAELEALAPDIVLFDAENGRPDAAFSLLNALPNLLLLGISPDGNVVRLWSERQYRELSTQDLAALLEAGCDPPTRVD